MPVIRCTQKLLTEIGSSGAENPELSDLPLDEWYANLVILDRQKCVVFINPATLFVAISYGKRRNELRQLQQILMESLRQALTAEEVEAGVIDRVVQRLEAAPIAETQDRKTLGCLNDVIRHFKWLSEREVPETKIKGVVKMLNRIPWVRTQFGYALIPMEQILHESFEWSGRFEK
ncbi:MAG: hypothetical protein J0L70_30210 [Leptolyngbya sp. UWPOB_LEPTO1]|uniref:DUF6933 domain-containing protein n=1 Tax=Leptolyngbya sp. UWPOB_LEPTO1 TaxID=2815653 RepID=UPI001AC773B3|nr:hypothetical protein [Leptolyngbya sp. UWPOB_LEPTO1]MBN8564809.1 hypothetical protein [Leptolyngbya sp. UWPOB_LEPTO1]